MLYYFETMDDEIENKEPPPEVSFKLKTLKFNMHRVSAVIINIKNYYSIFL